MTCPGPSLGSLLLLHDLGGLLAVADERHQGGDGLILRPGQGFCNEDHRETLEGWLFAAESWQGCSLAASILYRGSPQPLSLVACGDYGGPAFAGSCWQLLAAGKLGNRSEPDRNHNY